MKKILDAVAAVGLVCMLGITVAQIVFRVMLKISSAWSDELSQYAFAFIVFVGAAAAFQNESHITIAILLERVPEGARRVLRIAGRLLVLPFMIPYMIGAFQNAVSTWNAGVPSAEWMHIGYMYGVLFASGLIMLFYLTANTWYDIIGKARPAAPSTAIDAGGGVL